MTHQSPRQFCAEPFPEGLSYSCVMPHSLEVQLTPQNTRKTKTKTTQGSVCSRGNRCLIGSHKTPFSKKKLLFSPAKGLFFPPLVVCSFCFSGLSSVYKAEPRKSLCSLPHRMGSPMSHTFATLGWDLPHKWITCEAEAQPQGKYKNSPSPCRERAA